MEGIFLLLFFFRERMPTDKSTMYIICIYFSSKWKYLSLSYSYCGGMHGLTSRGSGGEKRLNSKLYNAVWWCHLVTYAFLHEFWFRDKLETISHGTVNSSMRMVNMNVIVLCFECHTAWQLTKPPEQMYRVV